MIEKYFYFFDILDSKPICYSWKGVGQLPSTIFKEQFLIQWLMNNSFHAAFVLVIYGYPVVCCLCFWYIDIYDLRIKG